MKISEILIENTSQEKKLTTDVQKKQYAEHIKFIKTIPKISETGDDGGEFHEVNHTSHHLYSGAYMHKKDIPAVIKFLKGKGFKYSNEDERLNKKDKYPTIYHTMKHADGREVVIRELTYPGSPPDDTEITIQSNLEKNAPSGIKRRRRRPDMPYYD